MHTPQRWFYGHGPMGEMVIENNQSALKCFGLFQSKISSCLRRQLRQYSGWTFQWIEGKQNKPLSPRQFRNLQIRSGLSNMELVECQKINASTLSKYRNGTLLPPADLVDFLKQTAAKKKHSKQDMENRTTAGIRHLMADLYPQWCDNTDGVIFVSDRKNLW